ncbi:endoplasmin [Artemisia annua]|uniref:Endoplasmin n=1 Tax=Artemisia annua TaxID=35608 RepID=A0A2U1KTX7_ARTAN|nr:endoplasmin [Artemisia annua]
MNYDGKWEDSINEKYPHIVYEERRKAYDGEQNLTYVDTIIDVEEELVTGLSRDLEEKQFVAIKPVHTEKAVVDAAPEPPVTEPTVESTETPTAISEVYLNLSRHHLKIIVFQQQIKVDTALPDTLSTIGVSLQREKMLPNVILNISLMIFTSFLPFYVDGVAPDNTLAHFIFEEIYRQDTENGDVLPNEVKEDAQKKAFDKIRLLSLTDKEVLGEGDDKNLEIQIKLDKENKILSICDNGVGMTKEDLIKNLGTIAKSGTSGIVPDQLKTQIGPTLISDWISCYCYCCLGGFAYGVLRRFLPEDKVESVQGLASTTE